MAKRGINTQHGGHAKGMRARPIAADPGGNREQRRAARKLGITRVCEQSPSTATPGCPHCGRASHGFACTGTLHDGGDAR